VTVTGLAVADVVLIKAVRQSDSRGWFNESYKIAAFQDLGLLPAFVKDNEARSFSQGTVQDLHFQRAPFAQAKLVRCVAGEVYDVAVDIRQGSKTFCHHLAECLDAEDRAQLFIPAGFGYGYCTLEPATLVQ
jgi:dTDP-4-dehydrorhamnose 3,5-epimerase